MGAENSSVKCKEHKTEMIIVCPNEKCNNRYICEKCYPENKGKENRCIICNGYICNDAHFN